jgi:hypothetical protein
MKNLFPAIVFAALLIYGTNYGQELKVFEVLPDDDTRAVKNGDWIHEDRELLVEYPKDRLVWITVTENDRLIKEGDVKSFITWEGPIKAVREEPYRVPVRVRKETGVGLGKDGQQVEITAFKMNEKGEYVYDGSRKFNIYKPGVRISRADSFNATPLIVYETGKKVEPAGEKTSGLNAGFGGTVLFFIVTSRAKLLARVGLGPNVFYSNTEVLEEGAAEAETRNVANAGITVAIEIPTDQKIYFLLVGGWGGLNVTGGRYNYFGVGITTPIKF